MIPTGTSFGLLGSNGAGKSTILRLLTGIYKAESGNVTVDGDEVFDNTDIKSRVFSSTTKQSSSVHIPSRS